MWNNKEFRLFFYACLLCSIFIACVSYIFPLPAFAYILICFCCLFLMFAVFTKQRYRSIEKLSHYLQNVYNGLETMDIRDHKEGELSVLKSDIYKITSILKQQSASLQKDKTFLADALGNISHQLKTPLTGMLVMSELLQQEDLPKAKRMEFIAQIQTQLRRIEWLVTSLLKISKIDAQAIEFHRSPVSLKQMLEKAIAPISIPMELKEQSYSLECHDHLLVLADENWCVEAFVNILKNCMEHTPHGGKLMIRCEDNPLQTNIEIRDNGCGIDREDLPYIFERFYKGKNASSDSAGIGLSLSKMILLEQNASIEAESEAGKGSCFTIRFHK